MAAVALWKRGRVDYEVEVRSRPDATGMVESGSHRIVSALRAVEAWLREGGAL